MVKRGRRGYDRLRALARRWFAENIRAERHRLELTQEEAAELVGFSLQYLQRIERQTVNVPLDTIARFAYAYEVDPCNLLRTVATPVQGRVRSRRGQRQASSGGRRRSS
ncbi:MAG: helix-turn-helix transcriptional regulator [Deltaproteobacteria bacterium]|nr:helix-turn-helix transcriptional regulator [Deltaproteobacteria bacterium]